MTCYLEQSRERISQRNVRAFQERSIPNKIVTQVVGVSSTDTCKAQFHSFGSCIMKCTISIQTSLTDHSTVGQEVIVYIVTDRSTERHAQIPILIQELSRKSHDDISSRFLIEITVTIVDTAVTVTIDIHTFNRFAVFIVNLLVNEE